MGKRFIFVLLLVIIAIFVVYNRESNDTSNTLRIATYAEPGTLDPHYATGTWEAAIIDNIFSGLFQNDRKGTVSPDLAKKYTVSKDGKTYTFYLKDSRWSDGSKITAGDFVYSYKRMLDPLSATEYASLLYIIKGAEAYNTGKTTADSLGVKAISDDILQIQLEYPASFFPEMLAHHAFYPIPKHVVEKFGKAWVKEDNIVSSGAYKLKIWKSQSYIKATKNDYYYDASKVRIASIVFYPQADMQAVFKRYRAGEIDIASIPLEETDWVKENLKEEYKHSPAYAVSYLTINYTSKKNKALGNKEIRQALAMAIDRDFIVDVLLKKVPSSAYSFIPDAMKSYNSVKYVWAKQSQEKRLEHAKAIMKKYGYTEKNPLKFELAYMTSKEMKMIAVGVADMWKKIGVITSLVNTEPVIHYGNLHKQRFEVAFAGWSADYKEPSTFFYVAEKGNAVNSALWDNVQYNKLIKKAKATINITERNKFYQKAEEILLDDAVFIPIYFSNSQNVVSKRVGDYVDGIPNANSTKYLYIKQDK